IPQRASAILRRFAVPVYSPQFFRSEGREVRCRHQFAEAVTWRYATRPGKPGSRTVGAAVVLLSRNGPDWGRHEKCELKPGSAHRRRWIGNGKYGRLEKPSTALHIFRYRSASLRNRHHALHVRAAVWKRLRRHHWRRPVVYRKSRGRNL